MTETETDHSAEPVEVTLLLPPKLHARYLALVSGGLYRDLDDAVGEAMRTHLRSDLDASHHVLRLDLEPRTEAEASGDTRS